jgi:cell division septation protein DedD
MKRIFVIVSATLLLATCITSAQTDQVRKLLKQLAAGKTEEVRKQVPELLATYPDHPGVLYLHAASLDDAKKALDIYDKIIRTHGDSEWADDAYWRIIQYYAIAGNIKMAQKELDAFRKKYPNSDFLSPAADVVATAVKINSKPKIASKDATAVKEKSKKETKAEKQAAKKNGKSKATKEDKKKANGKQTKGEKVFYGLQIGVFRSDDAAKEEKDKYKSKGVAVEIREKEIGGEKMWSVVVGNYSSQDNAEKAKSEVQKACNCNPLIIKK